MNTDYRLQRIIIGVCLLGCCLVACVRPQESLRSPEKMQSEVSAAKLPGQSFLRTELYFGLSMQQADGRDAEISEQQWQAFLDTCVTPRFPDGLTVMGRLRPVDA